MNPRLSIIAAAVRRVVQGGPAPGGVDPLANKVVSLLRFEGVSGGTVITDDKGVVWTPQSGSITTETDIKKYGSSAGKFTYTTRYTSGTNLSIGSAEDFCVEFWFYLEQGGFNQGLFDASSNLWAYIDTTNTLICACGGSNRYTSSGLTIGAWNHVAIIRKAGVVHCTLNGVLIGTTFTSTVSITNVQMTLGWSSITTGTNAGLRGRMDNFRLTVGDSRYTVPFTPEDYPSLT